MRWTIALISRIESSLTFWADSSPATLRVHERAVQSLRQCAGFCARTRSSLSFEPGCAGGRSRSRQLHRCAPTRADPMGGAGRERHPENQSAFSRQRIEIRDRAVGDPVGVVPVARDWVEAVSGAFRVAAGFGCEQRRQSPWLLSNRGSRRAICRSAAAAAPNRRDVHCELGVLEAAVTADEPADRT